MLYCVYCQLPKDLADKGVDVGGANPSASQCLHGTIRQILGLGLRIEAGQRNYHLPATSLRDIAIIELNAMVRQQFE